MVENDAVLFNNHVVVGKHGTMDVRTEGISPGFGFVMLPGAQLVHFQKADRKDQLETLRAEGLLEAGERHDREAAKPVIALGEAMVVDGEAADGDGVSGDRMEDSRNRTISINDNAVGLFAHKLRSADVFRRRLDAKILRNTAWWVAGMVSRMNPPQKPNDPCWQGFRAKKRLPVPDAISCCILDDKTPEVT